MENQAIIESFLAFKEEKNIDRTTLMAFIEEAFRNQLRKKYETDENFDVIVNPDKGDLEIWPFFETQLARGVDEFKLNPIAQIPRGEATPQKMFSFSHEFENEW